MINKYITPVINSNVDFSKAIALYDTGNRVINVGYPGIAAYKPLYGNMYGFNTAVEKGYFMEVPDYEVMSGKPVYAIGIDESNYVLQFIEPVNRAAQEKPIFSKSSVLRIDDEGVKIKRRAL